MHGKTGVVRCHKRIINSVTITNNVGGTTELPAGNYRVRITKVRGLRCIGVLLDPKDVLLAKATGTSEFSPEHYRDQFPKAPHLYADALKAAAAFDPSIVYFSADDFTETQA